jgi:acetoin utilization protein AcuC
MTERGSAGSRVMNAAMRKTRAGRSTEGDCRQVKEKKARTSFCEQKEAKKLYLFLSPDVSAPREAEQKSFLVLFFKKELLASLMSALFIGSEIFRLEVFAPPHPLAMPRAMLVRDLCAALGWLEESQYYEAAPASVAELTRFHDPGYIAALMRAEAELDLPAEARALYRIGADSNVIHKAVFRRPATSVGGALLAASLLAQGGTVFAPGVGNHHGQPARASGFCFVNDIALFILRLRDFGLRRIAYVDLDAHHGDGVEAAFCADPDVLTLSVHEAGRWPRTGLGHDPARSVYNFPVPPGFNDAELAHLLETAILPRIEDFRPEVVLFLPGADALGDDSMSRLTLSNHALWDALRAIRPLSPRLAVLGGGGYNPYALARCWAGLFGILNGREPPETLPEPARDVLRGVKHFRHLTRAVPAHWLESLADARAPGIIRREIRELGAL